MATRTVATRLRLDIGGYLGPLKAAGAGTREFGREFDKASQGGSKGFDKLSQGALLAGGGILAGFGLAVKSAMAFDKAMSAVGAAADAQGASLDSLRTAALDAGAATSFSATEAAKAEEELAKAGVSVKDILGGGLSGALNLAAAGQLDVGKSAEIAATAMTQFGLEGSKVPHIADLLSATANKAQGSVEDVGMALKQGGLVASQFGLSIEETTGSLAAFAKAGLIGSDAGTSLKTMLLALANPSKESAALMQKLGINAYDASGKFVGMAGLAGNLRQSLAGLTQQQRDQALAQIFGADATRAANVLYRNGAEGIKKWTGEVDDAGNAARTAAAKTDNLAGDLERLGGSFETALIKQGSGANGVLRTLSKTAENMVSGFAAAPNAVQSTVTVMALLTGGVLATAGAYGVMAPRIRAAQTALVGMGAAGRVANTAMVSFAKGAGAALAAITAMQIAGTAMANTTVKTDGDVRRLGDALTRFGQNGNISGEMVDALGGKMGRLKNDLKSLDRDGFAGFGTGFGSAIEKITATGNAFDDSIQHSTERVAQMDTALAELAKSGRAEDAARAFERISQAAGTQGVNVQELAKAFPQYTSAVKDAKDASDGASTGLGNTAAQARSMAGGLAGAVREAGNLAAALSGLNDVNVNAAEAAINWQGSINGLTGALKENRGAWYGNSTAALANRQAVIDRIKTGQDYLGKQFEETKATRGLAAATSEAAAKHAAMRTQIINSAVAAGVHRAAAIQLVDALFRIPKNTPAGISAPGAVQAKRQVDGFNASVNAVEHGASTTITAHASAGAAEHALNYTARDRTTTVHVRTVGSANALEHRWGGIDYHAARGRIEAHTVGAPTVLYGERETGGEAFVPRYGDRARSRSILDTAASWYGGVVSYGRGGSWSGASIGGRSGGDTYILSPTFTGPVGSQMQLRSWLAGALDDLKRRGRA